MSAAKVDRVARTVVAMVRATGRCSRGLIDDLDAALGAPADPVDVTPADLDEVLDTIRDAWLSARTTERAHALDRARAIVERVKAWMTGGGR